MNNFDLNERFLTVLKGRFPKQSVLITIIEDALSIERESAYRRLKGLVQFSIREMGILAKQLNISLDSLLVDDQTNVVHLNILSPRTEETLDTRLQRFEEYLNTYSAIVDLPDNEAGGVYSNLAIEFFMPYKELCKFIYYRWGQYYLGPEKCRNYAGWKIPDKVHAYHSEMMKTYEKINKVTYIWDRCIILDLVHYLKFYVSARVLEQEDVEKIKRDMHMMLNDLERVVAAGGPDNNTEKIDFYLANIKIGFTYVYTWSNEHKSCYLFTVPMQSTINYDEKFCNDIKKWVKSLKKTSTLISGTGDKERILFFKEQHEIVDSV